MTIRDRVKELRRVPVGELRPHPMNWRTHSRHQKDVLRGLLSEVGFAGALLARELPDGSLQLIDGHLRAETTPTMEAPVLVLDLDDGETEKVLLTHDPLSTLAGVDDGKLTALLGSASTESDSVRELFAKLRRELDDDAELPEQEEIEIPPSWQVVVEVDGEETQREVYERMRGEGYKCRVLTL